MSRLDSSLSRITSSSDSTLEPPWQRRFVNPIQLVHVVVDRCTAYDEPWILRNSPDCTTFDTGCFKSPRHLRDIALLRTHDNRRWPFAKKLRRIGGRKSIDFGSHQFVRIEAGFPGGAHEPA